MEIFQKRIFVKPLRTKSAEEVLRKFDEIVKENRMEISVLQSDR
jgi:hypothetical protein